MSKGGKSGLDTLDENEGQQKGPSKTTYTSSEKGRQTTIGNRGISNVLGNSPIINGGSGGGRANDLVPVDPALLPASKITFSNWIMEELSKTLLAENPYHTIKHWKANKEQYWGTFADWAQGNPVMLQQSLYLFMADENNWIFQFFPIKISQASTYVQEILSVNQELSHIGVRKVPFRNISASVLSKQKHAIYTKQGFEMDYHFMVTPDGMEAWDRMVDALTANLWSFVIYQSMNELLFEPSFYRRENKLYPYSEIPQNVDKLFDYEQNNLFIVNKQPQAFHTLIKNSGRVFEQAKIEAHGIILPRSLLWYSHARDPTNIYYDKSGPISLRERETAGQQKTVDGLTMYPVPLVSGKLHDGKFSSLLDFQISLGGFTRHRELTLNMPACEYSSEKRSIRFASASLNQMTKYTLLDVLRHVPEFYPIDYKQTDSNDTDMHDERERGAYDSFDDDVVFHNDGSNRMFDNPSNPAGQINRSLLWLLINDREEIFREKLRTKLKDNEHYVNPLIRYVKAASNNPKDDKYYPIDMFGELAECNARTKYMMHVYSTMECRLFEDIGADGIAKFERGMLLAKELNTIKNNDSDKIADVLFDQLNTKKIVEKYQGMPFVEANVHGGPTFKGAQELDTALNKSGIQKTRPYGMGSISGFLTLAELYASVPTLFNKEDMETISDFVDVYKFIVERLIKLCPSNPCLSPRLLPLFNWNQRMTEFTKIMIVAWNTLFTNMVTPNVVTFNTQNYLTQFTFEYSQGTFFHALLDYDADTKRAFLNQKFSKDDIYKADNTLHERFEASDSKMFGGSLFTALPFVDPALPFLERSGDIKESLSKRQDVSIFPSFLNTRSVAYRPVNLSNKERKKTLQANESKEYTESYYNSLVGSPFLRDFPASITHMIANPIVKNNSRTVSDFEARIIASHTSYTKTLGVAARAVLFSRINLQTITTWFDNNIRIPFGAMCLRPFETQVCTSAIAVAKGPLGNTFFSGFDNHVSFDPSLQQYQVQAACQTAPVVTNNKNYLMLPAVQGGAFLGGKGHMFVNQNSHMLIQDMEKIKYSIDTLNGVALGDYSIIATLTSYNNAIEKQEYPHIDLRNNYRRENFVGRLHISPRDFVDERPNLTYCAAPILNALFDWNHPVTNDMLNDLSFAQYMYQRSHNTHVHETLYEEWDVVKGSGWVKTKSYHPWAETEQDNCENVQTSHASVVKAIK